MDSIDSVSYILLALVLVVCLGALYAKRLIEDGDVLFKTIIVSALVVVGLFGAFAVRVFT